METGLLAQWNIKPGDHVKRGDIIAEVETDKGIIEIEVFEDGIIEQILIQEGKKAPVGSVLALIRSEQSVPTSVAAGVNGADTTSPSAAKPPAEEVHPMDQRAAQPPAKKRRIRVSPIARKLASELGVDLSTVQGSGPHGAINRADVEQAALAAKEQVPKAAPKPAPKPMLQPAPEPTAQPAPAKAAKAAKATKRPKRSKAEFQPGMRRAIAAAMARSNRDIPHYYLQTHIDMSKALRWLEAENKKRSIKERILPVVLLIKAVAKALEEVPELNGYWLDDEHQVQEAINIGFAIALRQGGLVTPAIHNADMKSLDELMANLRDLIMRTRAGRLRSSEMTDATITLTSLGDLGVETVYGVIYPPQVGIVGLGKITEQPWAENGMLGIRPILTATLAGDHRATDGRRGGQFLDSLNKQLQEPEKL